MGLDPGQPVRLRLARWSFRVAVSVLLSALPAYLLLLLLRVIDAVVQADLIGSAIETLNNVNLPWLTAFMPALKKHAPLAVFWAAGTVIVFQKWSQRIELFTIAPQDLRAMRPRPGLNGHVGIVPWVEPTEVPGSPESHAIVRTWADQRAALNTLFEWACEGTGDGFWRGLWPRQPREGEQGWKPLKLALLTGANGVGKSSLAGALGARMAGVHLRASTEPGRQFRQSLQRAWHGAAAWGRTVLPFLRRRDTDPWDCGTLVPSDDLQLKALSAWEPRRPTLLILDEPDDRASKALQILAERRDLFWHPVRVLLIDQTFPLALDSYLPSLNAEEAPAVPLQYSGKLALGDVQFDTSAVRAMWHALCEEQRRISEQQRSDLAPADRPDFSSVSEKLWASKEVETLLALSGPNPLHIALAMAELAGTEQTLFEMKKAATGGAALTARTQEELLLELKLLDRSRLQHRLIAKRAADLLATHERLVRQEAPGLEHEVMSSIAAASVTGGLSIPRELASRLGAAVITKLFPGRAQAGASSSTWIPPVRPVSVAKAYLQAWLDSRADPDALAREIALIAWQCNPEGAMLAMHKFGLLPEKIASAVAQLSVEHGQRVQRATACCAALLYNDGDADVLSTALDALTAEECARLAEWLAKRLDPRYPIRPDPMSALIALLHVAARAADGHAASLTLFSRWSALAGDTPMHRPRRLRALVGAVRTLMQSGAISRANSSWADIIEVIESCWDLGRGTRRVLARVLIRRARRMAGDNPELQVMAWRDAVSAASGLGGERALKVAQRLVERMEKVVRESGELSFSMQVARVTAWRFVGYATSGVGGARSVELSRSLAERVDELAKEHPSFAGRLELQQQRATAWRYATYAASVLGGDQAVPLSRSLAARVEEITREHPAFLAEHDLQRQSVTAWQYVAYAASQLETEQGFELAREMAERADSIFQLVPSLSAYPRMRRERALAWRYVALAASQLSGQRGLDLSQRIAERVEEIICSHPGSAGHPGLQEQRAYTWRHVSYAAHYLDDPKALDLSLQLAERVEAIVTADPDFAAHPGLQEHRATAWRQPAYATHHLEGEKPLELSLELAQRVEAIVCAHPDFAEHADLQEQRATAWRHSTYAAQNLGGERGIALARSLAHRVEAIVCAQPAFALHAGMQEERAIAWRDVARGTSLLRGQRAFDLTRALAERVEAIACAQPAFASHAGLQEQRASAWRDATVAATTLGESALNLSQELAERVDAIVAANPAFAANAKLQAQRASAWRSLGFAACKLGGERAVSLAKERAQYVEQIVCAQPHFALDPRLQDERATAWRHVAYAACELRNEYGRTYARELARHIRSIIFAPGLRLTKGLQKEWNFTEDLLKTYGIFAPELVT